MTGTGYEEKLRLVLQEHRNEEEAVRLSKYMRYQFEFFGLRAPLSRGLVKEYIGKNGLPDQDELVETIKALWSFEEREMQMAGLYIMDKMIKNIRTSDLGMIEFMITTKSWWDTVDHIAKHHAGKYFSMYPEKLGTIDTWLESGNVWLIRSAILFQLGYKEKTNEDLLSSIIERSLGSKEFFINKAIGWALREYGKTNPEFTIDFVNNHTLAPLSKREALKLLQISLAENIE
ncbi:DNA alkylation repair protein [Heyndrickxia sp. MSNUG]|uniref:DNA alkylation repair protein n=1 Tax=Heyndrickxia sp. MSNUG TaxID=3136677 RepID=UPI003C2AD5A5